MMVVTTNLTYVENGILAEFIVSDTPMDGVDDHILLKPVSHRLVFLDREEAIKYLHSMMLRYHPVDGDLCEVVNLKDTDEVSER